jgi:hypothetical protein
MKKLIATLLISTMLLTSCGHPLVTKVGDNPVKVYGTVGVFTWDKRSRNVCYELSVGNIIWSILLIETIVMPVYFVGFSLWNPVRLKTSPTDDCLSD